jgi:hypothetical protein
VAFHNTWQYENNRCEAGHGRIEIYQIHCPKSPPQTNPSDLRGAQALRSCDRRAIAASQRFTTDPYLDEHIGLIPQGKLGRAIGVR